MNIDIPIAATGWEYIANGCYGTVYGKVDSPWVIKKARNDGTRTYLEWVWIKTLRGERMRGMPHLDFITQISDDSYMVGMKRYKPVYGRFKEFGFVDNDPIFPIHQREGCPAYILALLYAWKEDCQAVEANDLHSGNFMADGSELILTDPSSSDYRPVGALNMIDIWKVSPVDVVPTCDKFALVG